MFLQSLAHNKRFSISFSFMIFNFAAAGTDFMCLIFLERTAEIHQDVAWHEGSRVWAETK